METCDLAESLALILSAVRHALESSNTWTIFESLQNADAEIMHNLDLQALVYLSGVATPLIEHRDRPDELRKLEEFLKFPHHLRGDLPPFES